MDLEEALRNRRSVRRFKNTDISETVVRKLLVLANAAPSAGNLQARDFVVVREQDTKRRLATAALDQEFVAEAPVVVVVCANRSRSATHYGTRGAELYCIQDCDAAVENLLLAVHGEGLGACWVGAFDEKKVSDILKLPAAVRPLALIPMGVPETEHFAINAANRFKLDKLVHHERW